MDNNIINTEDPQVVSFYNELNRLFNNMNLNINVIKFVNAVSSGDKSFTNNPLSKGMVESLVAMLYGEDYGKHITERQTIEKLSIIVGEQILYESIFYNNDSKLRNELLSYDINYDMIIKNLTKLSDNNNKEENLAAQIELELLYGLEQKLLRSETVDIDKYRENLYTRETSPIFFDSIGYENLSRTKREFKSIVENLKNNKPAQENNNYNRN